MLCALNQFNELPMAWALFVEVLTCRRVFRSEKHNKATIVTGRERDRERGRRDLKKSMDKSNYIILESHPVSGSTFVHIHTQIVYVSMYKFVVVTLNGIFMLIVKLCQSIILTSNNFSLFSYLIFVFIRFYF